MWLVNIPLYLVDKQEMFIDTNWCFFFFLPLSLTKCSGISLFMGVLEMWGINKEPVTCDAHLSHLLLASDWFTTHRPVVCQAWENSEGWNDPLLHPSHPEKLIDTGHSTVLVRDEGKETLKGGHSKYPPFLFNYCTIDCIYTDTFILWLPDEYTFPNMERQHIHCIFPLLPSSNLYCTLHLQLLLVFYLCLTSILPHTNYLSYCNM